MFFDTTIAAISTAYGESGIGIIRLSGPESLEIIKKIFCPGRIVSEKAIGSFELKPRYMHYGHIADPESLKVLDEVLCVYMKAPASYTGEDCCEIQCHGGMMPLREILSLCFRMGAEPAERGEFTKRAFINGRLDLAQAEAVMDLISASGEKSYESAVGQVMGSLSERVRALRAELLDVLVKTAVNMDYPDEDIEQQTLKMLSDETRPVLKGLEDLLSGAREGRIIREGLSLAIVGRPNVGKSSLMNALLRSDRSIVTDIPGTTRDTVEEKARIRGISVRLTDTAGIRESSDTVEKLGIERSRAALERADLVIMVFDGSEELKVEDRDLVKLLPAGRTIAIVNKCDLPQKLDREETLGILRSSGIAQKNGHALIGCCAKDGRGLEELSDAVENFVYGGLKRKEDPLLTNMRHINLAEKARESLLSALEMMARGEALDLAEIDLREAFGLLGEITGDSASDEVINTVFERFCLGK